MPPMHTVGTPPWPFSARTDRLCLSPSGPMTFLVFVFLHEEVSFKTVDRLIEDAQQKQNE